jgi:hypothetical protein
MLIIINSDQKKIIIVVSGSILVSKGIDRMRWDLVQLSTSVDRKNMGLDGMNRLNLSHDDSWYKQISVTVTGNNQ